MITCSFEDGVSTSLRHAVADVIVVKDNKILLANRSEKLSLEPGKWTLPGGFVDRDETVADAATREVLEETGYQITNLTLLRINSNPHRAHDAERQNIDFVFFADGREQTGQPDWESSEIQWFPLDKLPPKEQIAFDHYDNLQLYTKYKKKHFILPILS